MRLATLGLALVLALTGTAAADKADALFKKGKKLLAEKRYADACSAFEQVDKLDPGIGAKLNVARCYEEWGRLARAYQWYVEAHKMAVETKDDRAAKIKERLEDVDGDVPRVTIRMPEGADPVAVTRLMLDGQPVVLSLLGEEQRVDPGPHVIEYTVNGEKKKKMAPVERGGSSEVMLDIPKAKKTDKPDPGETPEKPGVVAPPVPGRNQRIIGISVASAGLVTMGIAGIVTLGARGTYNDAIGAHCMGTTTMCDPEGLTITRDARHTANIATVVTLLGGAALAGGIVLYVLAPAKSAGSSEHALYITPEVGTHSGTVVFGGRF
jgi:hypothetical protein